VDTLKRTFSIFSAVLYCSMCCRVGYQTDSLMCYNDFSLAVPYSGLCCRLRDGFFNPDMLYEVQMIDEMMRGLVSTPMENQDQFMSG
jgi:hypothetical protein